MKSKLAISPQRLVMLVFLGLLFLATRFYHLQKLPIFADEAIYIRWSQVMKAEPSLRFLPMQDGKQPLFMWLTIPFLKVFSPLVAGRLVSVFSGLFSFIGILFLGYLLNLTFKELVLVSVTYLCLPFVFFFERMALVDSLLSAFGVWSLNLSLLLAQNSRLDVSMLLGFVLGGSLLTKSPGKIFVGLSLFTVLVYLFQKKKWWQRAKSLVMFVPASLIALLLYNILRLGPNFHMIGLRNQDYVWSFGQLAKQPFIGFSSNLPTTMNYYFKYFTPLLFVFSVVGITYLVIKAVKNRRWDYLVLLSWIFVPLLAVTAIARTFTARYILFTVPGLILAIVFGLKVISRLIGRKLTSVLFVFSLIWPLLFIINLWFHPAQAHFPVDERAGYLEEWTSGWGIEQIAGYIRSLPKNKSVLIGTEGYFGTLPDGLQIEIQDMPNVNVIGVGQPVIGVPESLEQANQAGNEVYLVVNQSRFKVDNPEELGLKLIKSYNKPGGDKLLLWYLK